MPGEGHGIVEAHVFGGETDVPLGGDLFGGHWVAEHLDVSAILVNEAHEDADGGGFAGAVGTDEAHDGAGGEIEVNVFEREEWVLLADAFETEGEIVHTSSSSCLPVRPAVVHPIASGAEAAFEFCGIEAELSADAGGLFQMLAEFLLADLRAEV